MTSELAAGRLATRTLLDRVGRIWHWNPNLARRPGDPPGAFCHRGQIRTEHEIENEAEPIIEVRDSRVLTTRLEPVPAGEIRLNDLVVLPGLGELSPVIGLWPCADPRPCLYVCTDNGDWVRRPAASPVLRATIRRIVVLARSDHERSRVRFLAQKALLHKGFAGQVKEDPSTHNERISMSATITTEAPASPAATVEDPFALDLRIITDVPAGHPLAACKGGTDDGCDPTCASACISDPE